MNTVLGWLLIFWLFVLVGFMAIGGFFMFRKFFKVLPKKDGMSTLDWQNHYVDASRDLWTEESKALLDKLVSPVPGPFRDIAKHSISAKIGEVALKDGATEVTQDHCIKGYILATPSRDYKFLTTFLDENNIDYKAYEHLLER